MNVLKRPVTRACAKYNGRVPLLYFASKKSQKIKESKKEVL